MADWASGLADWASGLAGWPKEGNGWMDRQTDGPAKNLPILQDFVPYWGRCPKRRKRRIKRSKKREEKKLKMRTKTKGKSGQQKISCTKKENMRQRRKEFSLLLLKTLKFLRRMDLGGPATGGGGRRAACEEVNECVARDGHAGGKGGGEIGDSGEKRWKEMIVERWKTVPSEVGEGITKR